MITINKKPVAATGVTVENEPIIKSDGAGEVMQWQPSDGAADGIFITEDSANDPLRLGIGTSAPEASLEIRKQFTDTTAVERVLILDTHDDSAVLPLNAGDGVGILFKIPEATGSAIGASIDAEKTSGSDGDTSTQLVFRTSQNDETLDTALTIASSGLATFSSGIAFTQTGTSATGAATTSSTLDHYEEGTWTPALSATGYTFGYTRQEGIYTRIGNMVSVKFYIRPNGTPSGSGTVATSITGLPFAAGNVFSNYSAGSILMEASGAFFSDLPAIRSNANTAAMTLYNKVAGGSSTTLFNCALITSSTEFEVSLVYHTA
jgi:hypothetical protein